MATTEPPPTSPDSREPAASDVPDESANVPRYIQIARSVPLSVAIIAPLITLLDVPALSSRWKRFGSLEGPPVPDSTASIAMSVVSLVFCALGNVLMIIRFSSSSSQGTEVFLVQAPTISYWIKTIVEVVNIAVYGGRPEVDGQITVYSEGFWCAVLSCFLSGICAILLLYHYAIQRNRTWKDTQKIRVDGRHFLLSILSFVSVIGLEGLVFSKIESWYYFDGIYFAIVTVLTIGFGDLVPTKTVTRTLLFPFSLVGIALLGYLVSMIISYFGHRTQLRRRRWAMERRLLVHRGRRALLDAKEHKHSGFLSSVSLSLFNPFGHHPLRLRKTDSSQDGDSHEESKTPREWSLVEEMAFLESIQKREQQASQALNIITSLTGFISFWVIGSAIFSHSEGWTYGNSLYFSYVFFFSTGYGDFAPKSSFGRVFFVLWALMAVPIVASLAVQTLTNLIEAFSENHLRKSRSKRIEEANNKLPPVRSHSDLVHEYYGRFEERIEKEMEEDSEESRKEASTTAREGSGGERQRTRSRKIERELTKHVLELATLLESQARGIMISTLPRGGSCQTLLRADRNVQKRDVLLLNGLDGEGTGDLGSLWDDDEFRVDTDESSRREAIHRYRETFSRLLVAGAELRQLEYPERGVFLRSTIIANEKDMLAHGRERAEVEMELMDQADGDVEVEASDGEETVAVVEKRSRKLRMKAKSGRGREVDDSDERAGDG